MEDLGFRALGRGRALEGESEGVNVREGGSAGEEEKERERLSFNCCGAQNKYNRINRSDRLSKPVGLVRSS